MATPAQIQAALDPAGTGQVANITVSTHSSVSAKDMHYVVGLNSYAGRSRWITTSAAGTASSQAAAILAGLAG